MKQISITSTFLYLVRIKSLVSECILQSISYVEVISLFTYLYRLQDSGTGAGDGVEAGMTGSNVASDGPQTGSQHHPPKKQG